MLHEKGGVHGICHSGTQFVIIVDLGAAVRDFEAGIDKTPGELFMEFAEGKVVGGDKPGDGEIGEAEEESERAFEFIGGVRAFEHFVEDDKKIGVFVCRADQLPEAD